MINVDDARAPAQQQQTEAAARADQKLARQLEQERLAQEKQAAVSATQTTNQQSAPKHPATPVSGTAAPLTKITAKSTRPKTKKTSDFVAEVPGSAKKKTTNKSAKTQKAASAS